MRALVALAVEDGRDDADDDEHGGGERQPLAGWPLVEERAHVEAVPVVRLLGGSVVLLPEAPGQAAFTVTNLAVKVGDPMVVPRVTRLGRQAHGLLAVLDQVE